MRDSLTKSSYKYCEKIAKEHYENFPVASFLIPKETVVAELSEASVKANDIRVPPR